MVPLKNKAVQRKTLQEVRDVVHFVLNSLADYKDLTADGPIVEGDIVEEDAPWDLCHPTVKEELLHSDYQKVPELRRDHALMVLSDVRSVQ